MFQINWNNIVNWLMHPDLKTDINMAFLNVVKTPLQYVYNKFTTYRNEVNYKLNHNGQVCYLRGALNDSLDVDQRRITVEDSGDEQPVMLYPDESEEPVIIDPDSGDDIVILQKDSGYLNSGYDFIVVMPEYITDATLYRVMALVDFYKLAGKRYDVNYPNP